MLCCRPKSYYSRSTYLDSVLDENDIPEAERALYLRGKAILARGDAEEATTDSAAMEKYMEACCLFAEASELGSITKTLSIALLRECRGEAERMEQLAEITSLVVIGRAAQMWSAKMQLVKLKAIAAAKARTRRRARQRCILTLILLVAVFVLPLLVCRIVTQRCCTNVDISVAAMLPCCLRKTGYGLWLREG